MDSSLIGRALVLALGSFLFITSARAELQLSPKMTEYDLDGVKMHQLAFSTGKGKDATYTPPRGWNYSGSANQLTLHPPNKPQAEAIISRTPAGDAAAFDDAAIQKLVEASLGSVPNGSTGVELVSQQKNPVMIERKETLLLVLKYNYQGQPYNRSILFLNREKEQIRFQLTCRQSDFAQLQKAFLESQFSWQNL